MGWDDPDGEGGHQARRTLKSLCGYNVLRCVKPRDPELRTKTYQPYDFTLRELFESKIIRAVA